MEIDYIKTDTYAEILWPKKIEKNHIQIAEEIQTSIVPAEEKNPLLYASSITTSIMVGIRFFDIRTAVINEKTNNKIVGQPENYSSTIYFGKRLSLEDTLNEPEKFGSLNFTMNQLGIESAILCDCGILITNPDKDSITLEEFQKLSLEDVEEIDLVR